MKKSIDVIIMDIVVQVEYAVERSYLVQFSFYLISS